MTNGSRQIPFRPSGLSGSSATSGRLRARRPLRAEAVHLQVLAALLSGLQRTLALKAAVRRMLFRRAGSGRWLAVVNK